MSQHKLQLLGYLVFGLAILLPPLMTGDAYLLNKLSRYLVFAIVAVALSLSWGFAGILNLGQATSFGIGAYCMAMVLKLKATEASLGPGALPDFMGWNNVTELPLIWAPFHALPLALLAGLLLPAAFAVLLGWFMFGGRISGVYVSIMTLAVMVVINLLVIDQQALTGGANGITDLALLEVGPIAFDPYSPATYYLVALSLCAVLALSLWISRSNTGLILRAIRDQEQRVRFFGYDVARYQTFVFAASAAIAGLGGMLYTLVMEFASPTFFGVPLSLSIVVWVAVGGRQSLLGSAVGALIVTGMQGALSESAIFLETWTLVMGVIFVLVVLVLPRGLGGLFETALHKCLSLRRVQPLPALADPSKEGPV